MKALTVRHPWAYMIAIGRKTIENRGRRTKYRGPLIIHASQDLQEFSDFGVDVIPAIYAGSLGCAVAVVDLVDCVTVAELVQRSDPAARIGQECFSRGGELGPICWVFQNIRRLRTPVHLRGMPGLFDVGDVAELLIRSQM